jgi:hypothetical protein
MVNIAGSLWTEGDDLHYLDATSTERVIAGESVGSCIFSSCVEGSLWVEGEELHWVDLGQWEYKACETSVGDCSGASCVAGSIWVEGTELHYVSATQVEYYCELTCCATGNLTSCSVGVNQAGFCNGSTCTSYLRYSISWAYSVCDDSCHHIELWHKTSASSSCTSAAWSLVEDDLACEDDPRIHEVTNDATDASGSWVYYCYRVTINRDSDDGEEDGVNCYDYQQTLYCPVECGGNGNGP